MHENIDVIDILNNNTEYSKFEKQYNTIIGKDYHRLYKNYENLFSIIDKHDNFYVLKDNTTAEVISFSGFMLSYYREHNVARIFNRHYVNPKFRQKSLVATKNGYKQYSYNTCLLLPLCIEKAKNIGLEGIFWSKESDLKLIQKLAEWQNKILTSKYQFYCLNKKCNVCRTVNDNGDYIGINPAVSCQQHVVFMPLKQNSQLTIPHS